MDAKLIERLLAVPDVRLFGTVGDPMLTVFLSAFGEAVRSGKTEIVVELMTSGGVADVGYRIFEEIRLAERATGIEPLFLGKTSVFSAGVTIMSGFHASRRFLTQNTTLLIHERRTDKQVHITGQIGSSIQIARELVSELEAGLRVQNEGFAALVRDTDVSFEEVEKRAATGWYLSAREALDRGLIAGIV
jgi:ATP-dependent protease ClpP protease subunit